MSITHNRLEFRWFELVIKYSCTIGCLSTMFSGWFYINDIGHGLISDSRLFHVWAVLAEKVACPKVALHIGRIYCTPPGVSIITPFCFMKVLRGRSQDMCIIARKELIYCTKNKKAKCLVQAIAGFFAVFFVSQMKTIHVVKCCQRHAKATTYQLHAVSNKSNISVGKFVSEHPHQEWGLRKVTHQHLIKFHEVDTSQIINSSQHWPVLVWLKTMVGVLHYL